MSIEMAPCPKCRELNSAASEECLFCDAPLPWSTNPAHVAVATGTPYGTVPIADPTGQGPVITPRRYSYSEVGDRHEWWITIVSFLFPIAGVYFLSRYAGNSPLRARSALYGLLPNILFVLLFVLLKVVLSAATINANLPVAPH